MSLFDRFIAKVRERTATPTLVRDDPDEAPAVTAEQVMGERARALRGAGAVPASAEPEPSPERPLHGSVAERAMMARARRRA